ncbi:MBL fold metallo-hydrolase [Glacieibacterium frigidum]|uniref:MBL fold metallo-hydrolase n=1 Tax=Glacieibacterium frigidum TaxID=2593303 RepID=A0A552UII5_9SPHN|nr:MBL fold metallo-hydrolase [Glacieibacterium frigidum]TRW18023.1 MBL fold metallo-hydrolase [Glacieibacterium frigidum]
MLRLLATTALLIAAAPAAASPAPAVAASPAKPAVHKFKVGSLEGFALFDATNQLPNDGKVLGIDEGPAKVGAVLTAAGVPADPIRLDINVLVLRGGGRTMMFDTGNGAARKGRMLESLALAGIAPASVTDIFITHGHGDHVGGLVDADGKSVFTKARIHMTAGERASLKPASPVTAVAGQVATFTPGATVVPGVQSVELRGHTPGHTGYLVTSGRAKLMVIGDSAHQYIVSVRQPEYTIAFDGDPATAEPTRRALLKRAVDEKLTLYAQHFPFPGVGTIRVEGDGYAWVPVK